MLKRSEYLNQLIIFKDKQLIKVVTGIRRCGKSTLFEIYREYLLEQGVQEQQIIFINLEDIEYMEIQDYKELYARIKDSIHEEKKVYFMFDEIQRVHDFQKLIDALYINKNHDIYITGSNAFLLSGELATLLSGRYVKIKMMPLSFSEYVSTFEKPYNIERLYAQYLTNSSFPYALNLKSPTEIKMYLEGILDSIILKDIYARNKLPNLSMLQSVIRYMFDNIANLSSTKKIADTLTSSGRKISVNTVESYLNSLTNSFILYKVSRFDIKGKQYLQTGDKYYLCDIGLRYALLGNKKSDDGHILENIIFLELYRRGYEIYVGKVGSTEVDFVAINEEGVEYYQVAYTLVDANSQILKRELGPLEAIRDHNPKYLLSMDITPTINHNGIKQMNAIDWLLKK